MNATEICRGCPGYGSGCRVLSPVTIANTLPGDYSGCLAFSCSDPGIPYAQTAVKRATPIEITTTDERILTAHPVGTLDKPTAPLKAYLEITEGNGHMELYSRLRKALLRAHHSPDVAQRACNKQSGRIYYRLKNGKYAFTGRNINDFPGN